VLLEKATSDFRIARQPYSDFPILLWDDMTGCYPANEFMRHYLLRSSISSKKSWQSVGQALYDYFSFLQAHKLDWTSTPVPGRKDLLAGYRDYSLTTAMLAGNTVRQRLVYLVAFYEYALSRSWIKNLPFSYEFKRPSKRGARHLAHIGRSDTRVLAPDIMLPGETHLPKFLTKEQVKSLLKAASSNPHHRMMIQFAVQSGLRRAELATFPASLVVNPAGITSKNIQVHIDPRAGHGQKTKGSRARSIWISKELMRDLYQYLKHHRGERASMSQQERKALFLNMNGEPFADDGKGISPLFKEIGERAGLAVHPHLLRHTYATHQLVALQRNRQLNRLEPVVFLQRQLGHASIMTTMIYLHIVNALADDAVLQYDDDLSMWAEDL